MRFEICRTAAAVSTGNAGLNGTAILRRAQQASEQRHTFGQPGTRTREISIPIDRINTPG